MLEPITARPGLVSVVALACVGAWWSARPDAPPVSVTLAPAIEPVEVEASFALVAQAAPPPPRRACPAPHSSAPMVEVPDVENPFIEHVLPAPTDARWIAMWSGSNLYVSYDAGASFTHVLEATGASLGDVGFDCDGRVLATANGRRAIYDGAKLRWAALPHAVDDAEIPAPVRYGDAELARRDDVVVIRRGGDAWQRVTGLPDGETVLVPGARPAVLVDDVLYAIDRARARAIMRWPAADDRRETLVPAAIDRANRVWGLVMRDGGDCDGTSRAVLVGRAAR
jgi:hypothetical protein